MAEWRYHAFGLNGDGTFTQLATDIPLEGVSVTQALSGVDAISGTITKADARFFGSDGKAIFKPWSTVIYAERDGDLITGGILTRPVTTAMGQSLKLEGAGLAGVLQGQPYRDDKAWIGADPVKLAFHMWTHYQAWRGGNIGMHWDPKMGSPVRVGTPAKVNRTITIETITVTDKKTGKQTTVRKPVGHATNVEAQPYRLAYYSTADMGAEFNNLASSTPFDYRVDMWWDGNFPYHFLRLGYPKIGVDRPDLRFVMGENVVGDPEISDSFERWWTDVLMLGAGEGSKMVHTIMSSGRRDTIARFKVEQAKDIQSVKMLQGIASRKLSQSAAGWSMPFITVKNSIMTPIGSWQLGDTITVVGPATGWAAGQTYDGRIISQTFNPATDQVQLNLVDPEA